MISRRTALGGLLIGGVGLATTGALTNRFTKQWIFGAPVFAAESKPLAIPKINEGIARNGVRTYNLKLQKSVSQFFDGFNTPTLGINGDYLGPTLKMKNGEKIAINVTNTIGEASTLHWHGLHLPAAADGGPHQIIQDGDTWTPEFTIKQRASMFWYHSHMVPVTGRQVYHGLAGVIYVEDDETSSLELPNKYGIDDIPLILQDRSFNDDGSFYYGNNMQSQMMGMRGNVLLVNGTVRPYFQAKTNKIRLRFLNGSNSRAYTLGLNDGRAFQQIASDGGLLQRPFATTQVTLAPGERAQIIVDVSDGRPVRLQSYTPITRGMMGDMMGVNTSFEVLEIKPDSSLSSSANIPTQLIQLPKLNPSKAVRTRRFVMQMSMGGMMMGGGAFSINGKTMDMNRIDEKVRINTTEIWQIENTSMMAHPFHIHDVQFRILDRNSRPPAPGEMGLKDTVFLQPQERVRLVLDFADYADADRPYMYHCHILEHEDAGMMGQFTVNA